MNRSRSTGGAYPTWIAIFALAGIGLAWMTAETTAPSTSVPDAGPSTRPMDATTPPPPPHSLHWYVEGSTMPAATALETCLQEEGLPDATVAGTAVAGLTIHHPDGPRMQSIKADQGRLSVRTPVAEDANRTARRHVLATVCLYAPDAVVVSDVHGRRAGVDWPQLGPTGGLPIESVIALRRQGNTWTTEGLETLGRRELGVTFPADKSATAKLAIRRAAATTLAGKPGRTRLEWSGTRARLVSSAAASQAGWWPSQTAPKLWILAEAMGPSRPLELPAAAPPKIRRVPRPQRPQPRRRPRPPKKAFWPDYR